MGIYFIHAPFSSANQCPSLNPESTYCTKRCRVKNGREALERKRKVLYLVSQWMELCNDFLRDDERVKLFMKVRDGAFAPKIRTLNWNEEWNLIFPFRLCAVTCWMTFMSTRPWKRTWGSCRNSTCCGADSEWLRSAVALSTSVTWHVDHYKDRWLIRCQDLSIRDQEVWAWPLKVWKSADTETELLFCSVLINESIQRLKRNRTVLGVGVTGLCYAMNYECMALLISKLRGTKVKELVK